MYLVCITRSALACSLHGDVCAARHTETRNVRDTLTRCASRVGARSICMTTPSSSKHSVYLALLLNRTLKGKPAAARGYMVHTHTHTRAYGCMGSADLKLQPYQAKVTHAGVSSRVGYISAYGYPLQLSASTGRVTRWLNDFGVPLFCFAAESDGECTPLVMHALDR